jgi:hypothetical protein
MLGIVIFGESANPTRLRCIALIVVEKSGPSQGRKDWRNV